MIVSGLKTVANYLNCKQTYVGSYVSVKMTDTKKAIFLCEVEIFQTKTSK